MLLAINWGEFGIKAGQLLLSLSILIILHEFGHFITARWFKCRVEKFYLFFDPWFSLFKKKIGETEYGIGWLPLGGYVKISGMIDESMDKDAMKLPAQSWEFRSKPAWQRLIIMIGGVTVNVLVAFIIYAMILFVWGDKKIPAESMKYGIQVVDSTLYKVGLRSGDKILAIDGTQITDFERMLKKSLIGRNYQIERNGKVISLEIPEDLIGQLVENRRKQKTSLIEPRIPVVTYWIPDTAKIYKSGLRKNDIITGINDQQIEFFDELKSALNANKNSNAILKIKRNGIDTALTVSVSNEGTLGFVPYGFNRNYEQMDSLGWIKYNVVKYGFFASFPAGVKKTGQELQDYYDQFKKILNPSTGAYKGIGGFKSMGSIFAPVWDWESFWRITALLSVILAFMNLLPIPALDGGHVLFTLIEMITGRKPNEKFLEYAQIAGMVLLLGLMLYANGNDLFGWNK